VAELSFAGPFCGSVAGEEEPDPIPALRAGTGFVTVGTTAGGAGTTIGTGTLKATSARDFTLPETGSTSSSRTR